MGRSNLIKIIESKHFLCFTPQQPRLNEVSKNKETNELHPAAVVPHYYYFKQSILLMQFMLIIFA